MDNWFKWSGGLKFMFSDKTRVCLVKIVGLITHALVVIDNKYFTYYINQIFGKPSKTDGKN